MQKGGLSGDHERNKRYTTPVIPYICHSYRSYCHFDVRVHFLVGHPRFSAGRTRFYLCTVWNYSTNQFGIFLYIVGTIVVTVATLILAVPLGLLTAIYLAEFAPPHLEKILRPLIDFL